MDRGRGLGLRPRARRAYHSLYDKGYKSIGCAPCTRATEPDEPSRAGRWWWESNAPKECGIHCSIESGGLEHELHALLGDNERMASRSPGKRPRSRAPRRRPSSRWWSTRAPRSKLADVVAAVDEGVVEGADADALAELLELGLSTGRVRALYGPEGEQAALGLFRRLPLGKELAETTRELNEALEALEGRTIEKVSVSAVGPGEYGVTVSTEDFEIALRLGKAGARVASIGT